MKRIMGTEIEYGISVPGDPTANPVLTSTQVVLAYAAAAELPRARRARWDYEVESPLRDARGFDLGAPGVPHSDPELDDLGAANVILTNGARLYVDHAHPEFSTPEVTNPRDAVIWDKAGERVMEEAAMRAATVPGNPPVQLYKNNVDGKGASYGAHENYLMARATPFTAVIAGLTPFFVSRQVVAGSGRVGIGAAGEEAGFQLSQRSDYIEVEVGLETTLKRGIINTRDEPHADAEKYRRLHVIVGDSNMSEYTTFVKVGAAACMLRMLEDPTVVLRDMTLENPIRAIRDISHDPTLRETIRLKDGRAITPLQLQMEYLEHATRYVQAIDADPVTRDVLARWTYVIEQLADDPMQLNREVDWVIKQQLIQAYMEKNRLSWRDPKVSLMDLQYHDIRPDKGLYFSLVRRDLVDRITDDESIERAKHVPPQTTRARLRGEFIRQANLKGKDYRVDWVYLKLNDPERETILCKDPFQSHDERVERLIRSF